MTRRGWESLFDGNSWCRGAGRYPITAYSEFMPPPRTGWKPYPGTHPGPFDRSRPFGWQISEYEEAVELRPGFEHVAEDVLRAVQNLIRGEPAQGIARAKLVGNPYWPDELAQCAGHLGHERCVVLLPLALSRTQDDKGRVRWTLFGSSEQGPDRAFWKSFFAGPDEELPPERAVDFLRRLLAAAYAEPAKKLSDLRALGFRILAGSGEPLLPLWRQDPLPSWTRAFLLRDGEPVRQVRYLLTFRPFGALPKGIRHAYLAGQLHLLPCPASLVFWGAAPFLQLQRELALAMQISLLNAFDRREAVRGLRVLQSGWMDEPRPGRPGPDPRHGAIRNTYRRTHRFSRVQRHDDELAAEEWEDRVAKVLFSSAAEDIGLYGKPMARNAQIWTDEYRLLLDGPNATRQDLDRAAETIQKGGEFGYRFYFPPMRVGRHEVFWHRPLVACLDPETSRPRVVDGGPTGYLTAYDTRRLDLARPVELWPDLLRRPAYVAAVQGFEAAQEHHHRRTAVNARKLLDAWHLFGQQPLPRSFARRLVTMPKEQSLDDWMKYLAEADYAEGYRDLFLEELRRIVAPESDPACRRLPEPLTFHRTATRSFEVAYWRTIAGLASHRFINKDNADCVEDAPSRALREHHHRDLDALADYLLDYHRRSIAKAGLQGKAVVGDLPFRWATDFDFGWSGGWAANRLGAAERNLLVMIPGRNRRRAVIMADHYDTAYMEDVYYRSRGGTGARQAAAGADDNHSATAALMLAAPVFCELSRQGRLGCDVWLVHLTGEEFPADCLGARHLAQWLVEGSLRLRLSDRRTLDLSNVTVQGVYVLDMVAHNHDRDEYVFQIAPGASRESMWLAWQAHLANQLWNTRAPSWNQRPGRRGRGEGRRSPDAAQVPEIARHPHLYGEIRPPRDPRSSLFNTDGQIFSDAGIPVVLFMENYDIHRTGYHDTRDTMAHIDLDYGAAVVAVAIESVARAANGNPGETNLFADLS